MQRNKVPAFTILEVTVAMMLTAILMVIVYTAFGIIQSAYSGFEKKNQEMNDLVQLDRLIKRDIGTAQQLNRTTTGLMLNIQERIVEYDFQAQYVLRRDLRVDTFKVAATDLIWDFQHGKARDDGIIDEFSFTANFRQDRVPYHYFKPYSSEQLLKLTTDAND